MRDGKCTRLEVPEPQKYVEIPPFGRFLGVLDNYFTYFGPGSHNLGLGFIGFIGM